MSAQAIAARLSAAFYTAENGNRCITDEHPDAETVKAMVFAADQSGLGWDFAYRAVADALDHVADTDNDPTDPDTASEFADGAVDVYNADRLRWLAESLSHYQLCDEAADDFGGFGAAASIIDVVGWGQYRAYTYAMAAVGDNWPDEDDDA